MGTLDVPEMRVRNALPMAMSNKVASACPAPRQKFLIPVLLMCLTAAPAVAEEQVKKGKAGYESDPGFAGPASTTSQLEEDDAVKEPTLKFPAFDRAIKPWFDWKRKLKEEHGLQLGVAYTSLYQAASEAPDGAEDAAGSGILRLSGRWTLLNRDSKNTGTLVISADHRHRYTDIAPADLGFSVGYLGIPGTLFSNIDAVIGDLNWQQLLNDRQTGLVVGRYDPNDFFDVLGYANPWTAFQNLAILFNTTIALPDWSTGIGLGHYFNDQWYITGAVNDVNGVATKTKFFEDFGELYTTAEIGWSPSRAQRYLKNIHLMGWHADKREKDGVEESEGIAIGANWTFDEKWMMFLKAGWSDGSAPLYNESATVGMIYYFASRSDLVGLGVNWGKPSDDSLDDQVSGELFYRLQLAQNLAITPSVQLIIDPALNPDENVIAVFGLRIRLTF